MSFPFGLFEDDQYEPGVSDRQWWAIFTKSRHEKALARDLERFEIPFFLPLVMRENRIRNRTVEAYLPLFSGYVFMFGCDDERVRTLTTNRVSTVLSSSRPVAAPQRPEASESSDRIGRTADH